MSNSTAEDVIFRAESQFLVSIVTVNYNGAATLPVLLSGVGSLLKRHPEFEHVIVDGASRDGSLELFEQHVGNHFNTTLISERDSGIYDAMNKGVRLARGQFFIHLNSDDEVIHPERWTEIVDILLARAPLVLTTPVPIKRGAHTLRILPGQPLSRLHRRFGYHFSHQGTFFDRNLFDRVGGYSTRVGYIADKIFCYQLLDRIDDSHLHFFSRPIAIQHAGGISSSSRLTPLLTVWLALQSARLAPHKNPYLRALLNPIFKIILPFARKLPKLNAK